MNKKTARILASKIIELRAHLVMVHWQSSPIEQQSEYYQKSFDKFWAQFDCTLICLWDLAGLKTKITKATYTRIKAIQKHMASTKTPRNYHSNECCRLEDEIKSGLSKNIINGLMLPHLIK